MSRMPSFLGTFLGHFPGPPLTVTLTVPPALSPEWDLVPHAPQANTASLSYTLNRFLKICFETRSLYVLQAGLELASTLLLQPPEYWDGRCGSPCPAPKTTFAAL